MSRVRALRITVWIVYASYLANVGMLLIVLPWSDVWSQFVLMLPYRLALAIDEPAVRGAITAFGVLHLILLLSEVVQPSLLRNRND
jgi:hypothetical protein